MKTHFFGKIRGNGLHKDDEVPVTQKTIAKQPSSKIERS
jgi:hypothetical protein